MFGDLLYLRQEDVLRTGACSLASLVPLMRGVFRDMACNKAIVPEKSVLRWGDVTSEGTRGRVNVMPAFVTYPNAAMGIKWIASFPKNRECGLPRATSLIILSDIETGVPCCVLEGSYLSAARTAAVNILAAEYLCAPEPDTLGIIGAGVQARFHLEYFARRFPSIKKVLICNRTIARAQRLAQQTSDSSISCRICAKPAEVFDGSSVIIAATGSPTPLVECVDLSRGVTLFQFCGNEIGNAVVEQFGKIYYDDWGAIVRRANLSPARMAAGGKLNKHRLAGSLGELVMGSAVGRVSDEPIMFCATGIAAEDISVASEVHRRAVEMGLGQRLQLWDRLAPSLLD